jgi:phosphoglycerol transferase MdoB-like AlkP superfamily enzyme
LLAGGIVFVIYGWRTNKVLAVINFSTLGGFAGHWIAVRLGMNEIACTISSGAVLGGLCIWQTRHGVSLLAGGAGGVLGASLAYSLKSVLAHPTPWIWAGFLVGFVTFALLAFIVYKVAALLYSSVQGSILAVVGVLSLLSTQAPIGEKLPDFLGTHAYMLPIMFWILTVTSIIIQQTLLKRDPSWAIDG